MRLAAATLVVSYLALAGITTFAPVPAYVVEQASVYFPDDVIERGQQYSFERRLIMWGSTLTHLGLLLVLIGPLGRRLTAACQCLVRGRWLLTLLLVGATCYIVQALLHLPFDIGRWAHLTAWGMTERSFIAWFGEYGLALAVSAAIEGVVLVAFYLLMRWLPRFWWLAATAGSVVLAALFALLLPIVISPLFNTFTPIGQTKWAEWEQPLHELVKKADAPVREILVMNASTQSKHSNAYFTGFGGTRRIVIYDNLLEKHNLQEVESILAHELGHWLHDHIVQGITLGGLGALIGFWLLARFLQWAERPYGLTGPSDPAGLPLILLAGFVGSWLVAPVSSAVSRHFERQADMMALELARQPDVFIAAEKKLAIDNIGNVAPPPWNVWLFATHPPAVERIQMAEHWRRDHP